MVGVLEVADASSVAADLTFEMVGPLADGENALANVKRIAVANAVNFILMGSLLCQSTRTALNEALIGLLCVLSVLFFDKVTVRSLFLRRKKRRRRR